METTNASDKEFFREQFKKQDEEWKQIHELILDAGNKFDEDGYTEQTAWPSDEENKLFVKTAIDYYMDHVKRFGLDEQGWPQTEARYEAALEAAHMALAHVQKAHETYEGLPCEQRSA